MSHFAVAVIGPDIEKQLQPYHEYECTGTLDEFVQDVDRTEEALKKYEESDKSQSAADFISDWYGWKICHTPNMEPSRENEAYNYGHIAVDESGNVLRCVDRTNPNKKWDWWEEGGRYSDRLLTNRGVRVNSCTRAELDIQGMRDEEQTKAAALYDRMMALWEGMPAHRPWSAIRESLSNEIEKARAEYHAQPRIAAINALQIGDELRWSNADEFLVSRETYLQNARDVACVMFAMVREGQWYERGEMGWWACVSNEKPRDEWNAFFNEVIESLPLDAKITIVDCHI